MIQTLLTVNGSPRLILFFAGWGFDARPFEAITRTGYDIMIVYDYRNESLDLQRIAGYEEIVVVGWSMGVYFADCFIRENADRLPITKCVAVNGTLAPVDNLRGIPERVYRLTERLPDRASVDKFYDRICGGSDRVAEYFPEMPQRSVDDLREELVAIRKRVIDFPLPEADCGLWDEILISEGDLIFPVENMSRAWNMVADRVVLLPGASHAVDFQGLLNRLFVDKELVESRFGGSTDTYDNEARVQAQIAERVAQRIADVAPKEGGKVLEVGSGSGLLTRLYDPILHGCTVRLLDLAPTEYRSEGNRFELTAGDAELFAVNAPEGSYDLIVSSSTIQWFNSPRRFLREAVRLLKPDGHAVISFFAKGTLGNIADIVGLRYPAIDALTFSGLDVRVDTSEETFRLDFATPNDALRHLRLTGVNSLQRTPLGVGSTREILRRISNPDGTATLSFTIRYITISRN